MNKPLNIALRLLATILAAAVGTYLAECFYWKKPFGNRLPKCLTDPYDPILDEERMYSMDF